MAQRKARSVRNKIRLRQSDILTPPLFPVANSVDLVSSTTLGDSGSKQRSPRSAGDHASGDSLQHQSCVFDFNLGLSISLSRNQQSVSRQYMCTRFQFEGKHGQFSTPTRIYNIHTSKSTRINDSSTEWFKIKFS